MVTGTLKKCFVNFPDFYLQTRSDECIDKQILKSKNGIIGIDIEIDIIDKSTILFGLGQPDFYAPHLATFFGHLSGRKLRSRKEKAQFMHYLFR